MTAGDRVRLLVAVRRDGRMLARAGDTGTVLGDVSANGRETLHVALDPPATYDRSGDAGLGLTVPAAWLEAVG